MIQKIPSVETLLKLLDDEDNVARAAILQLLMHYSSELPEILRQLQECDNAILRKRSHQIQSLITFRQRRLNLHNILKNHCRTFSISKALIEMHFMWYEKEKNADPVELYLDLLNDYSSNNADSLQNLVAFLKEKNFTALPDNTIAAELYMAGDVLKNLAGINSFMCALVLAINEDLKLGLEIEVINFEHKFYIYERSSDTIVDILQHWQIRKKNFSGEKHFSSNQLLKFIGSLCFCNAIQTDAFRCVLILGEILSENHDLSALPYPYGSSDRKLNQQDKTAE